MQSLAALADPNRRRIVEMLAGQELSAGEIGSGFEISAPAVSQHLKVLKEANIVRVRVEGQRRIYALDPAGFTELESMRAVGHTYLELHPDETLSKLLAELDPARGFAALDAEIRKQYAAGEVVSIAGWVIALTEARIYAVVALRP